MLAVWKFQIEAANARAQMPRDARILAAGVQNNNFVVWALVNPEAAITVRQFAIYGTGHPVRDDMMEEAFVNTVFVDSLVFHIFDLGED